MLLASCRVVAIRAGTTLAGSGPLRLGPARALIAGLHGREVATPQYVTAASASVVARGQRIGPEPGERPVEMMNPEQSWGGAHRTAKTSMAAAASSQGNDLTSKITQALRVFAQSSSAVHIPGGSGGSGGSSGSGAGTLAIELAVTVSSIGCYPISRPTERPCEAHPPR